MSYISKYTGQEIDNKLDQVSNKLNTSDLFNKVYPVGSIYMSYTSTSPTSLFGGTWTQIKDKVLMSAGDTYTGGSTGGSATHTHTSAAHTHSIAGHTHSTANHTLTVNEIPSHKHTIFCGYSDGANGPDAFRYQNWAASDQGWQDRLIGASGGGGAHNHGNTGSTSLTTNSTTPGATGSSSNLPPYLSVYMWKRTA